MTAEQVTKPKHPGRVAAGKRTAELNRKRKEDLLNNHKTVPPQVNSGTENQARYSAVTRRGSMVELAMLVLAGGALIPCTLDAKNACDDSTPVKHLQHLDNDIFRMH